MKKIKPNQLGQVLKDLSKIMGEDFAEVLSTLTFDGFKNLVEESGEDTGYLKSKWQVTVDQRPSNILTKGKKKKKYEPATYPSLTIKAGSTVTLHNNTEYATYLEHGTPTNRAQPMVEPTRIKLEAKARELAGILTRKKYNV